jgi:hypothetical protein
MVYMFLNVLLNVALLLGLGLIGFILKKKNALGEDPIKPFLTYYYMFVSPYGGKFSDKASLLA